MSHKLSHDQKRKAKLAKRRDKAGPPEITPYEGSKYQAPRWTPFVYATEKAIYEVIVLSERRLTNDAVRRTFVELIYLLRSKVSAALPEGAPEVVFDLADPVPYLSYKIRLAWRTVQQESGPVRNDDWIGILRTLLNSIEAHAWNSGASRGYVVFLENFIPKAAWLNG